MLPCTTAGLAPGTTPSISLAGNRAAQGREAQGSGMSGTPPAPPSGPPPAGGAPDPSMEDILASIRRILSEDEAPSGPVPMAVQPPVEAEVLALEPSMLVGEPPRAVPHDDRKST